jgi:plasmid stability protein
VATLNLKNVPEPLYRKLRSRARRERRSITQEVLTILAAELEAGERRSLLELRGLGREVWAGVDAAAHVEAERRAWD